MPDATITSTASTFGTITGTFAADQSTVTGTISGIVAGTLSGSVGVPGPQGEQGPAGPVGPAGPAGPGVPANGLEGQILLKASDTSYDTVWADNFANAVKATVRNESGATMTKGTVVYISGASGNKAVVSKASASTEAGSSKTFAILEEDIPTNQNGTAITMGLLKGIDTSAFSPGANLWLSTTPGQIVSPTPPASPAHAVFLGNAVRIHANQGEIEVRIANGYELGELHDVLLDTPANGQVLKYDAFQGLWINANDNNNGIWGQITGTLSNQTDLQSALDGKYSTSNPAGYITSSALTGYATESWVTSQGYLTSSALTPYLTKADNLGSLTNFATARDNLGLGSLNTPTFAGVNVPGSGTSVANLGATFLTINQQGSGQFTIQPSQGIVFPDSTIQTTAYPGPPGATTWGSIGGTLSNQTDLQNALNAKYDASNPAGYITSSALSPYLLSSTAASTYYPLSNPANYITSSALTGYATEAWVTSQGYLTASSLTGYATESWVTSQGYLTSSSLTGYATESWVYSQGYLTDAPSDGNQYARKNGAWDVVSTPPDYITSVSSPLSVTSGDLSVDLSAYLTTATAASTYQTQAAMSGYLTVANASATYAPLASPALTGNPTAPTPATSDNDTSIATTAFVKAQGYINSSALTPYVTISSIGGSNVVNALLYTNAASQTNPVATVGDVYSSVNSLAADIATDYAPLASPALTGTPTSPTASAGTSTTQIATTAFVTTADNLKANLASPTFTGTPAAPTAAADTNTTQIATTAFVIGQAGTASPIVDGTAAAGTSLRYARQDHVHPTDTTRAALASPAFTGTPTAPTAAAGTNTTQIATTAFVTSAVPAFATSSQARQFSSTTTAISPRQLIWAMLAQDVVYVDRQQFTITNVGTVTFVNNGSLATHTRPGNAGACSSRARIHGPSNVDQQHNQEVKANPVSHTNFSFRKIFSGRSRVEIITDPNFTWAFYHGKAEGDGVGDLTRRGFGWKMIGGTGSRFLELQVHNGTTLTSVTSSYAVTANVAFDWDLESDGAGNVTLYVNGSSVATSSAGPTGLVNQTSAIWQEEFQAAAALASPFNDTAHSRGRYVIINP